MQLGDRVKEIRKALGLTQIEFGKRISASGATISTTESGKTTPDNQTLNLICREFGVNLDYLLHGTGPTFAPKEATALDRIDQLLGGGNEFVKAVFVELADLSDEEWQMLHDFVQRVMDRTKNPGQ